MSVFKFLAKFVKFRAFVELSRLADALHKMPGSESKLYLHPTESGTRSRVMTRNDLLKDFGQIC